MSSLRVLILEDEAESRAVLREALGQLGTRVASIEETASLAEFRSRVSQSRFDLCLTDLVLPDGLSIDMIRFVRSQPAAPVVLVISSLSDEDTVVQSILAGASGYVSKHDSPVDMARAIEIAADGGSCISPTIAHRLMALLRKQTVAVESSESVALTARESEILKLAAKGCNYRQIAELTGTRPSTVYTHVRHIYDKLQVANLQQALYEARQRRLV